MTEPLEWVTIHPTLMQTKCATYQIARGDGLTYGSFTYRAYHRKTNGILATVNCVNEVGDRAAAVAECKAACVAHEAQT